MLESLLVRKRDGIVAPRIIARDSAQILSSISERRSSDLCRIASFTIDEIILRDSAQTDPLTSQESKIKTYKKNNAILSVRGVLLLFLTKVVDHAKAGRVVFVSRLQEDLVAKSLLPIRLMYPGLFFEILSEENLKVRMSENPTSCFNGVTYLIALVNDRQQDYVAHFGAAHALFTMDSESKRDSVFYSGELWLPPFAGGDARFLYLRVDLTKTNPSKIWDRELIVAGMERFRKITSEIVFYIEPNTGGDLFIFGKYVNDYSNMFAYYALFSYFKKLGLAPSNETFEDAFAILIS